MFARRVKIPFLDRLRDFFWPRIGFLRSSQYIGHRLARLPGTPFTIANGFAWGAAISFTPFVGLHFILSAIFAFLTRGSIVASAIGTVVGNPWTFPFIWALIYKLGNGILGKDTGDGPPPMETVANFFDQIWLLLGQWFQWLFGLRNWDAINSDVAASMWQFATDVFWPMLVGSFPCLVVVWVIFFVPLRFLVDKYQAARRRRMARAAAKDAERSNSAPSALDNQDAGPA